MKTRLLLCACALSLALVGPASALSNSAWLKRAYNDVLFRDPTSAELASAQPIFALAVMPSLVREVRWAIAVQILVSEEYKRDLLGANPAVPGYFQLLLGRNPTSAEIDFVLQVFATSLFGDEGVIVQIVGITYTADYIARAQANGAALGSCVGDKIFVNQLFLDLLGRSATSSELDLGYSIATGALLMPSISTNPDLAYLDIEYRRRQVRTAFVRYLRREPSVDPATAPDHDSSELDYFVAAFAGQISGLDIPRIEGLTAYLLATEEYAGGVMATLPAVTAPPPPAAVLVSNQIAGLPDPSVPPRLSLSQSLPPMSLNSILVSSNQTVHTLATQVAGQEATIGALVNDVFGGPVTVDGAQALLAGAQQKIADVNAQLFVCPPNLECVPAPPPKPLQHAQVNALLAADAIAAGDYEAAARAARRAYNDAAHAEKKLTR